MPRVRLHVRQGYDLDPLLNAALHESLIHCGAFFTDRLFSRAGHFDSYFRDRKSYDFLSFSLRRLTRCIALAPYRGLLLGSVGYDERAAH